MNMPRRSFVSRFASFLAAAALALPAALAFAAPQPWDEKAFQAAQAAGKPVLIDVYARW
jgi:thioredoxin 1